MSNSQNNKRIAINTILLYIRMLFVMFLGLYTSRVILHTLGIENYGIYNVVSGIVLAFAFLNSAMTSATSRFLAVEIGRKRDPLHLKKTFNLSLLIHLIVAVVIVILGETLGSWLLFNKLQIPESQMEAATWVLHSSIISTFFIVMSVPYNAAIVAHEKMGAFAYINASETVLKLLILFLLPLLPYNYLKSYAVLLCLVQLIVQVYYIIYCKRKFQESTLFFFWDGKLFKEMFSFASWNLVGNLAAATFTQGVNILLNIFFGAAVNAARGITVQVQNVIGQFCASFQMALNPQIMKSYAANNISYTHTLILASSKYSAFLHLLLSFPLFIEINTVLHFWFGEFPPHTDHFIRIILVISLIEVISNPIMTAVQATGKVKMYQLTVGGILLLILPCSYLTLKWGGQPESVFIVYLLFAIIAFIVRLFFVNKLIPLPLKTYFQNALLPILFVLSMSILASCILFFLLTPYLPHFVITGIATILFLPAFFYIGGLNKNEKQLIRRKLKQIKTRIFTKKKN